MKGILMVNGKPASVGFVSRKSGLSQFRYCRVEELQDLLRDLNLILPGQAISKEECVLRLEGDFSAHVLYKFGLTKVTAVEEQKEQRQQLALSEALSS